LDSAYRVKPRITARAVLRCISFVRPEPDIRYAPHKTHAADVDDDEFAYLAARQAFAVMGGRPFRRHREREFDCP
jgi:hypothetical protein